MRVKILTGDRLGQWLGFGWEPFGNECRMGWGDIGDFRLGFFLLLFSDSPAKQRENLKRYMQSHKVPVAAQVAEAEIRVTGIEDVSITFEGICSEDKPKYFKIMSVNFEVVHGTDEAVEQAIEDEERLDLAGSSWVNNGRGHFQTFMPCQIGMDIDRGTVLTFPLRPRDGLPYPGDEKETRRAIHPGY